MSGLRFGAWPQADAPTLAARAFFCCVRDAGILIASSGVVSEGEVANWSGPARPLPLAPPPLPPTTARVLAGGGSWRRAGLAEVGRGRRSGGCGQPGCRGRRVGGG